MLPMPWTTITDMVDPDPIFAEPSFRASASHITCGWVWKVKGLFNGYSSFLAIPARLPGETASDPITAQALALSLNLWVTKW